MAGKRAGKVRNPDERERVGGGRAPALDASLRERADGGDRAAQAVLDVAGPGVVQAKMSVGAADDPWERAADQAADAALRRLRDGGGAPPPPGDDAGSVRRSSHAHDQRGGGSVTGDEERAIRSGGGSTMSGRVLQRMEQGFGADLSGVRIHNDDRAHRLADGLQATAFTAGSDIWFGKGAYDPSSARGERVLAHEVAHVIQQRGAGPAPVRRLMSAKQFKASTRTDWHQRGDAIKAIDKHFADIEKLKAAYDGTAPAKKKASAKGAAAPASSDDAAKIANLERRIKLLEEMEKMAQGWVGDHTIEGALPAPAPAPAPGAGGAAPAPAARQVMDDPKRKRRMDGLRVLVNGGSYVHEKNKADKEITQKTGVPSLLTERQNLQMTLLSLKAAAGGSGPGSSAPVADSARFKKITEKYEGNAKSMFTKLAPIVNASVPNPGDAVEIDLEAKIPVDQNAVGFILFHLVLSANRDSVVGEIAGAEGHQNVVLRGELTAGAGVNVLDFLEFKAELGVYAETSANTAEGALTLLSYGVYRRWRESKLVPSGLVSYMYSGRRGEFGYQKSEAWANQVEKEQFSDGTTPSGQVDENDAYVETGVLGRVSGRAGKEINGIGTEIEASLTFGGGRRYNKESVERVKGAGNLGARNKTTKGAEASADGGRQALLSDDTFFFEIAGGFNITPVSADLKIMGKYGRPASTKLVNPNAWKTESVELQLGGGFTMPMAGFGSGMASKAARPVATALMGLPGVVRTIIAAKKKELGSSKDKAAKGTGVALDVAQASIPTLSQYVKQFGEADAWSNIGTDLSEATAPKVGSNLTFGLSLGFDFVEKELAVEFTVQDNLEVEIPLFFSGSVSKTKRIVAFTFDGGKPKVR